MSKNYKAKTYYGGQAVIEGVMMKGRNVYATAVRTPEGDIAVDKRGNSSILGKYKLFTRPIFRGMSAFLDSLIIGTKILMQSAVIAGEDTEEEPSEFEKKLQKKFGDKLDDYLMYFSVAVSIVIALLLFFMLPVWLGSFFARFMTGTYMLGVVEGLIRIAIFLIYIYLISRMKDIQRVFQYHGAEHKTINCFEAGEALTPENVRKHTRMHKRCGTSFLLIVMVVSMVVVSVERMLALTPLPRPSERMTVASLSSHSSAHWSPQSVSPFLLRLMTLMSQTVFLQRFVRLRIIIAVLIKHDGFLQIMHSHLGLRCRFTEQACNLVDDAQLVGNDIVRQIGRMDLRLLDLVAALARFRHVTHDAGKERPLRIADKDALEIDVVVSEKDLVRDLCLVLTDHLHEVVLVHDARLKLADDLRALLRDRLVGVFHERRLCALFGRERERSGALELEFF